MAVISKSFEIQKRLFDLFFSFIGLSVSLWVICIAWLLSSIDTRSNGFFIQKRIGRYGEEFGVIKIRTMRQLAGHTTTVTTANDPRVTVLGAFFRRTKIDELPQLWNVFVGDMSFVGPRPDVCGFADLLEGEERMILSVRPGITGPATLKYRGEAKILSEQGDPELYNRAVIWPDKVKINLDYIYNCSMSSDIKYILRTLFN